MYRKIVIMSENGRRRSGICRMMRVSRRTPPTVFVIDAFAGKTGFSKGKR